MVLYLLREMTSAFLKLVMIQVKADVETQGEFVESLANEVRAASFVHIDDAVAFVNWLDEELSFLVRGVAMLTKQQIQSSVVHPVLGIVL
jgi:hypothetical protein